MCSIIGFFTSEPHSTKAQLEVLWNIIEQSKIRGLHAFGYAYINAQQQIVVRKCFGAPQRSFLEQVDREHPQLFIANYRYSTSGDWHDEKNNQPLVSGCRALVINGVISMKPREEYEREFQVKCQTENDAEILLRIAEQGKPLNESAPISVASILLGKEKLYAFRNHRRPLHTFTINGAVYLCSTHDIAVRAGIAHNYITPLPIGETYVWTIGKGTKPSIE